VWLQIRLRELGYFGYAENTGYFGDATEQAVMRFQHDSGRPETGEVDAATVAALNRAVQVKP
jgi:peptidoglycan hydrolase-like protein with peptidoglycan-binding domain